MGDQRLDTRWWRRLDGQPEWWPQPSARAARRRTWVVEHPVVGWLGLATWMFVFQAVMGLVTGTMSSRYLVVAVIGAGFFATLMVLALRVTAPRPPRDGSFPTD